MKKIQCEVCGSTSIKKVSDTVFECQECGVQYSKEEIQNLLTEIAEKSNLEGTIATKSSVFPPRNQYNENVISENLFTTNEIAGVNAKVTFEIDKLVRCGDVIKAIRIYREVTGAGLGESKEAIDKYMQDNGIRI